MEGRAPPGYVARQVHCRRCGYNLYGLEAASACPECGLEVWETVLHTVDPAASRLPKLRNPEAVGAGLVWLMICLVATAVLLVLRPVATWIDSMDATGVRHLAVWTPRETHLAAGVTALAGVWWVWRLAPPLGEERGGTVWRDLRLLGGGLIVLAALFASAAALEGAGFRESTLAAMRLGAVAAAVAALVGLRGVLGTIGLRSREYRTARGGRQGIRAMIAALAGAGLGQVLLLIALAGRVGALRTFGYLVTTISALMLLIGLVYLVVNVWWIRRSLRCPPPRLEEVVSQ